LKNVEAIGGVSAANLNRMSGYQVTVLTNDTYTITVPSDATSTVSIGGGLNVIIQYLIGIDAGLGAQSSAPALGWGAGGWGNEAWEPQDLRLQLMYL
jgi:hypothetical protein